MSKSLTDSLALLEGVTDPSVSRLSSRAPSTRRYRPATNACRAASDRLSLDRNASRMSAKVNARPGISRKSSRRCQRSHSVGRSAVLNRKEAHDTPKLRERTHGDVAASCVPSLDPALKARLTRLSAIHRAAIQTIVLIGRAASTFVLSDCPLWGRWFRAGTSEAILARQFRQRVLTGKGGLNRRLLGTSLGS